MTSSFTSFRSGHGKYHYRRTWEGTDDDLTHSREKGDASKAREFLPTDKQYLVTRGVPCLRRATSLAYTDADEDAERLVSFADTQGGEADEWVETHAGRKSNVDSSLVGNIDDIPDLDAHEPEGVTSGIGALSLGPSAAGGPTETPDLDDIPDMEEDDLEEKDDATATTTAPGVSHAGCVPPTFLQHDLTLTSCAAMLRLRREIYCKYAPTT